MSVTHGTSNLHLIRDMFARVDSFDADAVAELATDDIYFRFGSGAPTRGKKAFHTGSVEFFALLAGVHHDITDLWEAEPGVVVAEVTVHYRRRDGSKLALPCTNIFRLQGGLVRDYRIYMDVNPVFAG